MRADWVTLIVNGQKIENFLSYKIEADIYTADDAWSLELAQPEAEIIAGQQCQLYVNDELHLTGLVDKVQKSYDKRGVRLSVEGRDLMGLLVDSYVEQFTTVEGKKLSELAEMLLKNVPYINRQAVAYQEDVVGSLKQKKTTKKVIEEDTEDSFIELIDTPQKLSQIEPGMTIFEVLRTYSLSRGLMFFAMPDGTFVFGRPKASGEPRYHLTCRKRDPVNNNVLSGERLVDLSQRYSKVTVIGQAQGLDEDGDDATKVRTKAVREDPDFPFYKPYVTTNNNDAQSPAQHARMVMEKQKHEGFQLKYRVPGHSQNGDIWNINELCQVQDEVLGEDAVYLIYGRTFEMDKGGVYTDLTLGKPGIVA
jgi:prophage tail gpP-like protein